MRRATLPIEALPAWCKLNNVTFMDTTVKNLGPKGFGLITERSLSSKDVFDSPTLLLIPCDLILGIDALEEHKKVDPHFHQLIEAAGGKSLRGDIMLFLLLQVTIASTDHGRHVGVSNPWTEYVKMLPNAVPVPTMWTEEEREVLMGTSLESALNAKMEALNREFESLQEKSSEIAWCQRCWWGREPLRFTDWVLIDAWYRSRCLELPAAGESMVPTLDIANHSSDANAFYEQTPDNVTLLLRPDVLLQPGTEIAINYGSMKSAAEMIFSYGFLDEKRAARGVVLNLEPFPDDPLGKAKFAAFKGRPVIQISEVEGDIQWESPLLYLACLNEEDGLEFKILQQNDGSRSDLRMFFLKCDVTNESTTFETLISRHELKDIFRLRVLALLHDRIRQQLERLYESDDIATSITSLTPTHHGVAMRLRNEEKSILEAAFTSVDKQKREMLGNENVLRYLGSTEDVQDKPSKAGEGGIIESSDEDDFS